MPKPLCGGPLMEGHVRGNQHHRNMGKKLFTDTVATSIQTPVAL
jgi:hypothetical protein